MSNGKVSPVTIPDKKSLREPSGLWKAGTEAGKKKQTVSMLLTSASQHRRADGSGRSSRVARSAAWVHEERRDVGT
jgi:hypothetical protein